MVPGCGGAGQTQHDVSWGLKKSKFPERAHLRFSYKRAFSCSSATHPRQCATAAEPPKTKYGTSPLRAAVRAAIKRISGTNSLEE